MRINDLVAMSLGTTPNATRKPREAGASRQAGDEQGGGRSRLATPRINFKAGPGRAQAAESAPTPKQDTVELSTLSPSRGASRGSRVAKADGAADAPASSAPIAGVTDEFIRQRAVYTYTMPIAGPNGMGSFSMTYEVESSYRVIRFIEPGQLIDAEA